MKTIKHIFAVIFSLLFVSAIAQVQMDHQLQFTGTGTDAKITGIQSISSSPDAANKIYVDTAIANRASSPLITHYIGEFYGGGIVVSVWDSAGVQHGLIADTSGDLSTSAVWTIAEDQSTTVPATGTSPLGATSFDNGKANTAAMIAQWGAHTDTAGTAASICQHYNNGGFTDWYLPSLLELTDCYNANRIISNIIGDTKSFSTTTGVYYWSSTEADGSDAWTEYFQFWASGATANVSNSKAWGGGGVRAVRRY